MIFQDFGVCSVYHALFLVNFEEQSVDKMRHLTLRCIFVFYYTWTYTAMDEEPKHRGSVIPVKAAHKCQ